jgi:hypothetical protein
MTQQEQKEPKLKIGYSLSIGTSFDPIGLFFPEMWCIDMN